METIIGLGNAGCNIAEKFMQYSQYDVYRLDTKKRSGPKFKKLVERSSHEEYEEKCPSLKSFFKDCKPPYLFVLGGSGTISGLSLRVIQQLKSDDVYLLYIKPDYTLLSKKKQIHDKITFQILQQYTRSAVFKKMLIVSNSHVEEILGGISITEYYDKINDMIVSTINMINICDHTDSVIDTFSDSIETARIATVGLVDLPTGQKKLFYPLQMPREYRFYYSCDQTMLDTDQLLYKKIIDHVKSNVDDKTKASYGIYSNDYGKNYGYVLAAATLVQEENNIF